jgi:probable HAF family extracellular repeat protein
MPRSSLFLLPATLLALGAGAARSAVAPPPPLHGAHAPRYVLLRLATGDGTALRVGTSRLNDEGQVVGDARLADGRLHTLLYDNGTWTDLGTVGDAETAAPVRVTSSQRVAGSLLHPDERRSGFYWSPEGIQEIDREGAAGIEPHDVNDAGQVVGAIAGETPRAFRWQDGTLDLLDGLTDGASAALSLNSAGQIAGAAQGGDGRLRPVVWRDGAAEEIAPDAGRGDGDGAATRINDSGAVIGTLDGRRGFLWQAGELSDLAAGLESGEAVPVDLNDAAQVAGVMRVGDFPRGFVWSEGLRSDLGAFGSQGSTARDINNLGQVVGASADPVGVVRGFLWESGRLLDLNSLLQARAGRIIGPAHAINDRGEILASARDADGEYPVLLIPSVNADTDLTVSMNTRASRVEVGERLTFTVAATNNGPEPAAGVALAVSFASLVEVVSARTRDGESGHRLASGAHFELETLEPGETVIADVVVRPKETGTLHGDAHVHGVGIDPSLPNNAAEAEVEVEAPALPDLVVRSLAVEVRHSGQGRARRYTLEASATMVNTGRAQAARSTARLYSSADAKLSSKETLGSVPVPALPPGGKKRITYVREELTRKAYLALRAKKLYARADARAAVEESDETNNTSRTRVP